ncbi:TPA: enoyl-CoA hydratase/isomerase family protein [Burkholderia cenocepacia]|nr:enoyl-CoA hydratase/isomerase family protein [Burkholderia cenocepacia]
MSCADLDASRCGRQGCEGGLDGIGARFRVSSTIRGGCRIFLELDCGDCDDSIWGGLMKQVESTEDVSVSITERGVATVTMTRPDQRNAMSPRSVEAMATILDELSCDGRVRCLILTGSGRGFCSGSDLKALAEMSEQARSAFERDCGRLSRAIARLPIPVIAAVHGFAIGGGLTLATSCDLVITTPSAKWALPEVPIGLFPAWGLRTVERRCGVVVARRLAWGVETIAGKDVVELGLADYLAEAPLESAIELGSKLADLPRLQASYVKEYFSLNPDGELADELANQLFMRAADLPEAQVTFRGR